MIQIAVPNLTGGEVDVSRSRLLRYNATLVRKIDVHDDLSIFRVKPDWPIPSFQAGQYVALGLGYWEPRVANTQVEKTPPSRWDRVVRRAYSISCSLLDERGQLIRVSDCDYLEFYITLVREAARPPALTPRMFGLEEGDRLFMEPHIVGRYTLDEVPPDDSVVLFGTGTGEAPHNAMITELLARGHRGRITCVTSVRYRSDLGYINAHRQLERRYANYLYLPLTTREPENIDPSASGFVGKLHVQDYVRSGHFEQDSGVALDPGRTQVFLCGSPAMIGYHPTEPATGMIQVLEERGFQCRGPNRAGNIHFERYW